MARKIVTIPEILSKSDISALINDFKTDRMKDSSAVILVYKHDENVIGVLSAGTDNTLELLGMLIVAQRIVQNDELEGVQ